MTGKRITHHPYHKRKLRGSEGRQPGAFYRGGGGVELLTETPGYHRTIIGAQNTFDICAGISAMFSRKSYVLQRASG